MSANIRKLFCLCARIVVFQSIIFCAHVVLNFIFLGRKTTNDVPNYDYVQVLEFLILIAKLLSAMKIFNNIEEIKKLKEEISNQYFEETKHDSNNESAVVKLCLYISKNNTNSENESSSSENQKILKWLKDEPKDLSIEINADENVRIEGKWEILKYCTCSQEENDSEQQVNPNALHLLVSQKLVHKLDQIYVEFYGFTRSNKTNDEEGDNSSVESL